MPASMHMSSCRQASGYSTLSPNSIVPAAAAPVRCLYCHVCCVLLLPEADFQRYRCARWSETIWRAVPTGLGSNKLLFYCSLPKHRTGTLRSVPPSTRCSIEWHNVAAVCRRGPTLPLHGPGRALLAWNLVSFACVPITTIGRGTGHCAAKLAAFHTSGVNRPHTAAHQRPQGLTLAPALLPCSNAVIVTCRLNGRCIVPRTCQPRHHFRDLQGRSAEVVPHSKWQLWAHSPFTGFSRYGAERKLRSASTSARRQGPASPVSMLMSASETLLGVPRAFTIGTEPCEGTWRSKHARMHAQPGLDEVLFFAGPTSLTSFCMDAWRSA